MKKAEFKDLLRRYLKNNCTNDEKQLVEGWYDLMGEEKVVTIDNIELLEEKIWNNVQVKTLGENIDLNDEGQIFTLEQQPWSRRQWLSIAASILFLIAIGSIGYNSYQIPQEDTIESIVYQNTIENNNKKSKVYYLEDSSKVILQSGSRLNIPIAFGESDTREVYLNGEATFEVTRDVKKPFLVHTGEIVTRVLGTSFKVVYDKKEPNIQVEVLTGKVAVDKKETAKLAENKNNGVVLTPNQKVVYHTDKQHFVTGVVDNPILIRFKEKEAKQPSFIYEETPIETIIEELEQNYGIKIVLDNERFNLCPFTADLSQQSLFSKLEFICSSLSAKYYVKGTTILIVGRGCN